MKRLAILLALVGTLSIAAKPNIAVVNIAKVFHENDHNVTMNEKFRAESEALQSSPRVVAVQEMDAKLKTLATTVRDKKIALEVRENATEEFKSLSIEYQSLVQEMETFLAAEKQKLTEDLVTDLEAFILEVREVITTVGKEGGFDLVLEEFGKTSTQTSAIIYLRNKVDITDKVLARLNSKLEEDKKDGESQAQ